MANPTPSIASAALPCDRHGSLILATRRLLEREKRSLAQLAQELNIPFYWLKAFAQAQIEAPSVNRVQYLYEKLSGTKIIF